MIDLLTFHSPVCNDAYKQTCGYDCTWLGCQFELVVVLFTYASSMLPFFWENKTRLWRGWVGGRGGVNWQIQICILTDRDTHIVFNFYFPIPAFANHERKVMCGVASYLIMPQMLLSTSNACQPQTKDRCWTAVPRKEKYRHLTYSPRWVLYWAVNMEPVTWYCYMPLEMNSYLDWWLTLLHTNDVSVVCTWSWCRRFPYSLLGFEGVSHMHSENSLKGLAYRLKVIFCV